MVWKTELSLCEGTFFDMFESVIFKDLFYELVSVFCCSHLVMKMTTRACSFVHNPLFCCLNHYLYIFFSPVPIVRKLINIGQQSRNR